MPLLTYIDIGADVQKGGSIREDLMDFITNVSPSDTPLFSNLGSVQVNAGFVEFQNDTLASAAANAFAEGVAATDVNLTCPTRSYAIVQNFQKHYHVSGREEAVLHAGLSSMISYQEVKKARELKRDIELALHRGSAISGDTDTAPQLAGMLNTLSTYFTASSGTTLTESVFNDIVTLTYSTPVNLREVYCGMYLKRTINQYSTSVQRYIDAQSRKQLDVVDVYESESGTMAILKSRDQLAGTSKTGSGNSWMAIDPDFFKVGWLRPVVTKELGLDGDRRRKMMVGELTLIAKTELAGCGGTGFVPYLVDA